MMATLSWGPVPGEGKHPSCYLKLILRGSRCWGTIDAACRCGSEGYHTILLVQRDRPESRTYYDLPSTSQAMERVTKMYEEQLKEINPHRVHITYDITDLYRFIDELADLSALVLDNDTGLYTPHGKAWIKQFLFKYFQQQAQG